MNSKKKIINNILCLCVNYNSIDETKSFIDSLISKKGSNKLHIVVVDNTPGEYEYKKLQLIYLLNKRIIILKSDSNLGYFGGINFGYKYFIEKIIVPDLVIVSNVDILIQGDDFFDKLTNIAETDPSFIIAPRIISSATNSDQNPFMINRPSKYIVKFKTIMQSNFLLYFIYNNLYFLKRKLKRKKLKVLKAGHVYAAHGAFLIFTKNILWLVVTSIIIVSFLEKSIS